MSKIEDEIISIALLDKTSWGKYVRARTANWSVEQMIDPNSEEAPARNKAQLQQHVKRFEFIVKGNLRFSGYTQLLRAKQDLTRMLDIIKKSCCEGDFSDAERVLEARKQLIKQELDNLPSETEKEEMKRLSRRIDDNIPPVPGIYVFTFPSRLKKPDDESRSHIRLKVGKAGCASSSVNVRNRLDEEIRKGLTIMPEPMIVVRVYQTLPEKAAEVEKQIHKWLYWGEFDNPDYISGKTGNEWFSVSLETIDQLTEQINDITKTYKLDEENEEM